MENDRPNAIPWPPMIYLGAAIVGVLAQRLIPLPWFGGELVKVLGAALAVAAIALDLATFAAFRKHKTTILPHRGATTLITTGPFAWSRNPIYLSNTALVFGAGLFFGNLWLVVMTFVAAVITQKLAIEREEKHLSAKFGAAWEGYAARVRRWV
jgi:protein-S-isoprenylcysteine O-methyltransferase Ste14